MQKEMCARCQKAEAVVPAYESDDGYCQKCADILEAQGDAYADFVRENEEVSPVAVAIFA